MKPIKIIARPSTAPLKMGAHEKRSVSSSPMANRPIGRPSSSIARLRLASALGTSRSEQSSPMPYQSAGDTAVIASLKGEILLVQRMLDTIHDSAFPGPQGGNMSNCSGGNVETSSSDFEAIERLLIGIQPSQMSDSGIAEAKIMLLELLVERVKAVSIASLRTCSDEHAAQIAPSRTSAFSNLVKYVLEIAERKRAWELRLGQIDSVDGDDRNMMMFGQLSQKGRGAAASPPSSPRPSVVVDPSVAAAVSKDPISIIDLALNEPTVSEIQKLISEQRQLQGYLRKLLSQVDNATGSSSPSNNAPDSPRSRANSSRPTARPSGSITVERPAGSTAASQDGGPSSRAQSTTRPGSAAKRKSISLQHETAIKQKQSEITALKEKLDAAEKEIGGLKIRLEDSNTSHAAYVKQEAQAKEQRDAERELRCRVEAAAYGNLKEHLGELGVIPSDEFMKVSDVESAAIVQRMNQLFFDGVQYCAELQGTAKGRKVLKTMSVSIEETSTNNNNLTVNSSTPSGSRTPRGGVVTPTASILLSRQDALDGVAWIAMHHQNTVIGKLIDKLRDIQAGGNTATGKRDDEIGRLHRVIKTLETRVFALKTDNTKQNQRLSATIQALREENTDLSSRLQAIHAEAPKHKRILNTNNQPMTIDEREKALYAVIADKEKNIASLTQLLKQLQGSIEEEQASGASFIREQRSLLSKCNTEVEKVSTLQQQLTESRKETDHFRDGEALAKRDVREKTVLEADATQRLWKLKVEMHISQNIIAELRKREQTLLDQVEDATAQKEFLRDQIDELSEEVQHLKTSHNVAVKESKSEAAAARAALHQERQRALGMERDLERLQVVDIQLETLEGNFNNYAASMIVKREVAEEEDRVLGMCLKQLQGDLFSVPPSAASEDEVNLLIRKLERKKELLEGEVRAEEQANALSRKQKKSWAANNRSLKNPSVHDDHTETILDGATNKKQLGTFLQQRIVEIQTFACQHKLSELRLERALRVKETELHEIENAHSSTMKDMNITKSQLGSLVHRASELELERKQLIKDRGDGESTIKKQHKAIQKLQLTNEEQDHMLVEVGTKLQKKAIEGTAPKRTGRTATSQLLGGNHHHSDAASSPNHEDGSAAAAGGIKPLNMVFSS